MNFIAKTLLPLTSSPSFSSSLLALSNSRIILETKLLIRRAIRLRLPVIVEIIPVLTNSLCLRKRITVSFRPNRIRILLALQNLQPEPLRDVERDVAVQEPGARVVSFKGNDDVAVTWHQDYIAARGVGEG